MPGTWPSVPPRSGEGRKAGGWVSARSWSRSSRSRDHLGAGVLFFSVNCCVTLRNLTAVSVPCQQSTLSAPTLEGVTRQREVLAQSHAAIQREALSSGLLTRDHGAWSGRPHRGQKPPFRHHPKAPSQMASGASPPPLDLFCNNNASSVC